MNGQTVQERIVFCGEEAGPRSHVPPLFVPSGVSLAGFIATLFLCISLFSICLDRTHFVVFVSVIFFSQSIMIKLMRLKNE